MTTATRHGDLQQPGRAQPTAKSRIGLIVALSMAAGLIAAVVLVAAPFIPARENVLTGVVLLAFALGWALLAVLSIRFSDQPQRWAAAPAVFMAVAGLVSLSGSAAVQAGVQLGMAASPVRAGCLDVPSGPAPDAQPNRTVAAVPRTSGVDDRLGGRRLRDRARIARRQGLSAARPADRRGRAPAAPVLHRLGQPHSRPGTGWRRVVLRPRLDCAGRGPRHQSLRVRPRRPRLERRQPTARRTVTTLPRTCTRCFNAPRSPGRTCWPVTRSAACTSKASPRNSPTRSPAWCSSTPPHPNPARPSPPTPIPTTSSVASPPYRPRPLTSEPDACSTRSPTPLFRHAPGTRPAPTPRPPATSQAPSRSIASGEHVDAAGVGPDQPQRQAADRPHRRRGSTDDQWQSKQDHMATLSTNSLHRHANATHAFAPRRRSRRCRSQPGNPRRRRRGTHLPAACPALISTRPPVLPALPGRLRARTSSQRLRGRFPRHGRPARQHSSPPS